MDIKNYKILVTGGSGFLGRHLINKLIQVGVSPDRISKLGSETDLRYLENCNRAIYNQDIVIHLAGRVGGIGFNQEKPGDIMYDNLIMGINVIKAALDAKVKKFVLIGTVCSYPKFCPVPFEEENLWNGYPEETNAPYGIAKKTLGELVEAFYRQYGFNAIYLLPVNLYGPWDNFAPTSSHVIPALIRKVDTAITQSVGQLEVWGSGKASREFLYVEDAAEAIVMATEKHDFDPEPVNIGTGKEITICDLVNIVCRLMNYNGKVVWDKSKPDGQPRRQLAINRAARKFGFAATTDFEQGLKETIRWYYNFIK